MSEARLDRIEAAIEANTAAIAANTAALAETDRRIRELAGILTIAVRRIEADQEETNRQIQSLIDNQQANSREHTAFVQSFQAILAEIRALWGRLAG